MTLVTGLLGKKSAWLAVDRRLTYRSGHRDDGRKAVRFEGADGFALIGYSGLGATTRKMQPSDWINGLLVGREGLRVVDALRLIADGMQAEMPDHLCQLPGAQAHYVIAAAVVQGVPRMFGIELSLLARDQKPHFAYHEVVMPVAGKRSIRIAMAGSGTAPIQAMADWKRELYRVLDAHEAGRVAPEAVADHLARLNHRAAAKDDQVSDECVVMWGTVANAFSHQCYEGTRPRGRQQSGPMDMARNGYATFV